MHHGQGYLASNGSHREIVMLLESVFMVRGGIGTGPFNTDFNVKFVFAVLAVAIVLFDWKKHQRLDYFWVLVFGTAIWTAAEAMLQLTGMRSFQDNTMFGLPLPLPVSIPFQGMVEGGFIAVASLFAADAMMNEKTRRAAIAGVVIVMVVLFASAFTGGIHVPDHGGDVPSRRDMLRIGPLVGLGLLTYANIAFFLIYPRPRWEGRQLGTYLRVKPTRRDRTRGWYLFVVLTVFGTTWTVAECLAGTRWIEVGVPGDTKHAPPLIEFLALAFDIVIEITVAYVPFYTLPLGLGLVKSLQKPGAALAGSIERG